MVGVSGIVAEKTGDAMDKYNRASALASEAAGVWRQATGHDDPHLAAAIGRSADAPEQIRQALRQGRSSRFAPDELVDRFEHFFAENEEIVPAAGDALARGDVDMFGRLVDRSQDLGERLLKNQVPETAFLARSARELGAAAASAFGAGFGGSVWALVEVGRVEGLLRDWPERYGEAFPEAAGRAVFFVTHAGPAACEL